MPERKRNGEKVQRLEVDPALFVSTDGTWSFFSDDPVYPDRVHAERAWRRCRRQVWGATPRTRLPQAAIEYDGLTRSGFEALWSGLQLLTFELAPVLEAIACDRQAVAQFRARDPKGAATIDDFLGLWVEHLDLVERVARLRARYRQWWNCPDGNLHQMILDDSQLYYGGARAIA